MPSRLRSSSMLAVMLLLLWSPAAGASAQASDPWMAASFLVYGRPLAPAELPTIGAEPSELSSIVGQLEQALSQNPHEQRAAAERAFFDAFGKRADADDVAVAAGGSYIERLKRHVSELTPGSAAYADVITRAYRAVVRRDPYEEEFAYWRKYQPIPYAWLAAAIEHWARRNQPGLMVTSGTPTIARTSDFVHALPVSPALAAHVRQVAGLAPLDDLRSASGRTVLAPGADPLLAAGRMHLLTVGRR